MIAPFSLSGKRQIIAERVDRAKLRKPGFAD
jgi:hypothetical protein